MSSPTLHAQHGAHVGAVLADFTVAVAESQDCDARPMSILNGETSLPPSVVLGELAGEPFTVDLCGPPSLRGSGMTWPPSAQVHPEMGCARFPISLAWALLDYGTHGSWKWQVSDTRTASCEPADAIASVVQTALARNEAYADIQALSLVVPNTIDVEAQDRILRALSLRQADAQLLWRPVAAALAWVREHGMAVLDKGSARNRAAYVPLGLLWVVHLGLDAFEATQLELIPWDHKGAQLLLPARRLPSLPTLYGAGTEWAERFAEQSQRSEGDAVGATWNLLWTTNWFEQVINRLSTQSQNAAASRPNLILHGPDVIDRGITAAHALLEQLSGAQPNPRASPSKMTQSRRRFAPLDGPFIQRSLGIAVPEVSFEDWIAKLKTCARTDLPTLGVVGTGAFAGLPVGDGTLCEFIVRQAGGMTAGTRTMIDSSSTILGCGAAIHAERRRASLPSYLDVLPKLELLIVRSGEPAFEDILRIEAPYVLGGQERAFEPANLGLRVRREERSLTLSVWREGHESVREVRVDFPRQITRDTPVSLKVKMTPGQGNPRIEVRPDIAQVFGGRRVYLDWARANDTGRTKEEELTTVPRTNPPLEPRLASLTSWKGGGLWEIASAKVEIEQFLIDLPRLRGTRFETSIKNVIELLQKKDGEYTQGRIPEHATVVSSDGCIHSAAQETELFDRFVITLDALLGSAKYSDHRDKIVRALGYCSADTPALHSVLSSVLCHRSQIEGHHLVALGNCLREPSEIALLARAMLANLQGDKPRAPNDWMRALCRVLQYRDKATDEIASDTCETISECCLRYLRQQITEGKANYKYRHASICIVYLLRRRRRDDGYLDPDSPLAERIKSTFRQAIARFKSGHLEAVRGFVNLPHVTQMMIEYIDRKGKGRLIGFSVGE